MARVKIHLHQLANAFPEIGNIHMLPRKKKKALKKKIAKKLIQLLTDEANKILSVYPQLNEEETEEVDKMINAINIMKNGNI